MRKPRDYDAELKALEVKAKALKARRLIQLGELVAATGADSISAEMLAGALLEAAGMTDAATKEAWRKSGAAFFSGERASGPGPGDGAGPKPGRATPAGPGAQPRDLLSGPA